MNNNDIVIKIENLTKEYKNHRGIFSVSLEIKKGEMFGFIGTNGAGKTTTIRNMMGFIKPDKGKVTIMGLDAYHDASKVKKYIGYVPGEIAFPDLPNGIEFLKSQAELLKIKDLSRSHELIRRLQLDPSANLKRMSKGMKQKTALVSSLMHDPEIIILDEPTTGLDPLMRKSFIEIVKEEHKKGKTIFMSSHMFEELEETCDRVALIDNGEIKDIVSISDIKNKKDTTYKIEFKSKKDYELFKSFNFNIIRDQEIYNQVTISILKDDINILLEKIKTLDIKFISEETFTLEQYFKDKVLEKVELIKEEVMEEKINV